MIVPSNLRRVTMAVLLVALFSACHGRTRTIEGEWNGVMRIGGKTFHATMHIQSDDAEKLTASLDDIDEQVMGLQAADVTFNGNAFSFDIPAVNGKYRGQLSANGKTIDGIWTKPPQAPSPLVFTRQSASDDADDD